eukprot:753290-Hanusia_phi.AAC.4
MPRGQQCLMNLLGNQQAGDDTVRRPERDEKFRVEVCPPCAGKYHWDRSERLQGDLIAPRSL